MLDPWIIEEIRRREQERQSERPGLEIGPAQLPPERRAPERKDEEKRGVVVIDLMG